MIITLPDVLIRSIFSFLTYSETRLKAATLCHRLLDHVEAFSGDQLNKIRETHQVDPSWNYRLGMQVNIPRERQPPTLSNRHMLKVARQTHLYSLSDRECCRGVTRLLCLPDGKTLISSGDDKLIRVWDLTTQRCVRAFDARTRVGPVKSLHFVAGRLVSVSCDGIRIWKLDGTLLHEIDFESSRIEASASCGNHVFLCSARQILISVVDVLSGEGGREKVQTWNGCNYFVNDMAVMGEFLLVLVCFLGGVDEIDTSLAGIHVLKQSDLVEESLFRGDFEHVASSEDSEYVVASNETGEINIFSVEDGNLLRIRVFSCDVGYGPLLVSASLIYRSACTDDSEEAPRIEVFDTNSGKRVRRLQYPLHDLFTGAMFCPHALASNGREIFCGLGIAAEKRSMSTIKAYLAY